jgi:hypothetical protein
MDNSRTDDTAPPTADIKTLHRELEQLFAGTKNGSHETRDKTDDTLGRSCLLIKGK